MNWGKYYLEHEYAPSQYHLRELDNLKPSMRFNGNNFQEWRVRLRKRVTELAGGFPEKRIDLEPRPLWRKKHQSGNYRKVYPQKRTGSGNAGLPLYSR